MREVKFRAWNKAFLKMMPWHYIKKFGNLTKILALSHFEVMQFTGRIDINGKEIYEGDIISVPYGIGKVEYADNQAMFIITWISDKEANNESLAYEPNAYKYGRTRKDLEIIGNIYENPELLK